MECDYFQAVFGRTFLCYHGAGTLKYADATASLPALSYLGGPRHARSKLGKRHPLPAILTVAVAAVLARAESYTAIAEWGGRLTQAQLKRTRARFDPKTKRSTAPPPNPPSGAPCKAPMGMRRVRRSMPGYRYGGL